MLLLPAAAAAATPATPQSRVTAPQGPRAPEVQALSTVRPASAHTPQGLIGAVSEDDLKKRREEILTKASNSACSCS
jgi:hypothetical protein